MLCWSARSLIRIALLPVAGSILAGCAHTQPFVATDSPFDLVPQNMRYSETNPTGYRPLTPARSDFGPAFVFSGSINGTTISLNQVICVNLYPNITAADATVLLNNSKVANSDNFGFDLGLLQRLIGANAASLNAKYGKSASYTVSLGAASDQYIPVSSLWDGKTPRAVDPSCKLVIDNLKSNNQLSSVFVVTRALTVQGVNYTFSDGSQANAGLTVDLKNLLSASPNASWTVSDSGGNTTVDPKQSIRIGVIVAQIDQWLPTGAVSAQGSELVSIAGHQLPGVYSISAANGSH